MRIIKIDCVKLFIPWQASMRDAMVRWRASTGTSPEEEDAYVIAQVQTDDGIVGIGEGGRDLKATQAEAEKFIGQNPLQCDPFRYNRPWGHALFDIIGQALGVPVHQLFGGAAEDNVFTPLGGKEKKVRDRIPVAYWSPYLPPAETAKHAEEGRERGFKVHKIKARPWDAEEQVKAMSSAAGNDYAIRIDPNGNFETAAITLQIDRALAGYNVECFEDPVPSDRLEWFRILRNKCRMPIALHNGNPRAVYEAVKAEAVDYLNIGGPPQHIFKAAAIAEAAGVQVWLQNEGHCYDIQAAFDAHIGAVIPNATLPFDTLHFLREGTIVENPLTPKDGCIRVPTEPGLGVKLDARAVERYRVE